MMKKMLKKYWVFCLLAPLFMLGEISLDLLQPDLMATIVDKGVLTGNLSVIINVGLRMIGLVFFGGFCGIMSGVFANLAAQRFGNDLRKAVFEKIMRLSFQQTDRISTGSLVTRLTNDISQIQMVVMMSMRSVVRCSIMFLGGVIMLYRQAPRFALIAAVGLPFLVFTVTYFMKKTAPLFSVMQKKLDKINNIMQETIAGARVVKAFVREDFELERFDGANEDLCRTQLHAQTLLAFMHPCMNIVLNLCVVAVIYVGGISVRTGDGISVGQIMAAITYLAMILHGVMFMANVFQTLTRAKASADRVHEVLACEEMIEDGPLCDEPETTGEIAFQDVSFCYPDASDKPVLDGITLSVGRGETLAVIGATGSGKSTLAKLIPRFYDVTEGRITVDGVDVRDYNLEVLRDKIAIVLQKAELYSRSIEENIAWGKRGATPFEIKSAAEIAQADDFICASEYGYYTPVTEHGHSLSGGQKQRISIARAILKNAEILIFDDSTSALDLKTEAALLKALQEHCPDTTKIVIAQRIASIQGADRIAVLEHGRIAALGTHQELMKTSDLYRDIYRSQLREGECLE